MSSLKYIFVIEDNQLVRKVREQEDKAAEQYFTDKEGTRILPEDSSSKASKPESGNKRNKTSRGK